MLMPAKVKHRKVFRGKRRGVATKGNTLEFGDYGLQSLENDWITARQIEAGRMCASHYLHRQGRVIIRIFPHKSVSSKPLETRMGKGKGEPEYWTSVVKPGTVLYEIAGVEEDVAKQALARVARKMPYRCRFVKRRHGL